MVAFPPLARAEVMDKVIGPVEMWAWTACLMLVTILLARWRSWTPVLVWPVCGLLAFGTLDMLYEPDLGPAILREAGRAYFVQAHLVALINALGPIAVLLLSLRSRRNR
jgi:hypothetical protein